mgnify:CR=1 FL=1
MRLSCSVLYHSPPHHWSDIWCSESHDEVGICGTLLIAISRKISSKTIILCSLNIGSILFFLRNFVIEGATVNKNIAKTAYVIHQTC